VRDDRLLGSKRLVGYAITPKFYPAKNFGISYKIKTGTISMSILLYLCRYPGKFDENSSRNNSHAKHYALELIVMSLMNCINSIQAWQFAVSVYA